MKRKIIFLLLIFLVAFSFLFSGPPDEKGPNSYCPHQYVRLNALMGVPVNCDEFAFMGAAAHPGYLLQQNFQRQNRPLYVVFGTMTGYSIYYLLYPFHHTIQSLVDKKLSGQFSNEEKQKAILYGSIYIAYIILNFVILFFSILLFEKSIKMISGNWKNSKWLLYAFVIMLISNQVTKSFFWTVHQQMFTIFTPVACIYTGFFIQKNKTGIKSLSLLSLIPGLLLLVYGNFILLLPVILFAYFLNVRKEDNFSIFLFLKNTILITAIFASPTLLWIALLKLNGTPYYNHEVSTFRHFVWITDSVNISAGHFFSAFYERMIDFFKTWGCMLWSSLLLTTIVVLRGTIPKNSVNEREQPIEINAMTLLIFLFLLFGAFLLLIGSYADRMTFSLAPILVFAASLLANKKSVSTKLQTGLIILIILIHFYTVFFNAPHFSEAFFYQ
jgi:hypothetical protein